MTALRFFIILCNIVIIIGFKSLLKHHVTTDSYQIKYSKLLKSLLFMNTISSREPDYSIDVAVIGGGPAGTMISWLLQDKYNCNVAIIDPNGNSDSTWYPNYGEWREEWEVLTKRLELPELRECTTTEWEITDTFFGGSFDIPEDDKLTLNRAYVRVDRKKMQKLIKDKYRNANGLIIESKLNAKLISPNIFDGNIIHDSKGSYLTLDNGEIIRSKIIIDATGLESRLVQKENPYLARGVNAEIPTGYQIAYGFLGTVDSMGPYDVNAMTLFDYRTSHLKDNSTWLKDAEDKPTFMYVMPLNQNLDGTYTVFWEETSLVGKDKRRLSFEECKRRAYKRLEYYNIKVLDVEEEEYCYIPMGGEIPELSQRGFGGAANMVHPSTGYHACRMMAAASDVAKVIGNELNNDRIDNTDSTSSSNAISSSSASTTSTLSAGSCSKPGIPDKIAALAYKTMWNQQNRGQRDFQAYGGDFLMRQPVPILRGFFSAFFAVDQSVWSGFLAGWPGLPHNKYHETWNSRLSFCFDLFFKMPNEVRLAMVLYAIQYTTIYGTNTLLRSLMPPILFGSGPMDLDWKPPSNNIGDIEAKNEARRLMNEFKSSNNNNNNKQINLDNIIINNIEDIEINSLSYPSPFQ